MHLCIIFHKVDGYIRKYYGTKHLVLSILRKNLSRSQHNERYLRTKIKSCEGKINAIFHNCKMPKD